MTTDELLAFAESLARISAAGGGPKAYASHLAGRCRGAVLVEDAEWHHLALAGAGERSVPPSARDLIRQASRDDEGFARAQLPDGGHVLAYPMRAGDSDLGWLVCLGLDGASGELAPLLRLTASAIAVDLVREAGGAKGRRRSFWERLLSGSYDDAGAARDDAAARGVTIASSYVAVAVEAEGMDEGAAARQLSDVRKLCLAHLHHQSGETVTIDRAAGFVFLIPAPLPVDAQNVALAASMLPKHAVKAKLDVILVGGVGSRAADILDTARSVDEAREALVIVRRLFGGGRVGAWEDLGLYPLLHRGATRDELQAFAQRTLEPLRAYDEKNHTELLRTLALYFSVRQNVKTASERLNVHRHTVFYRLRQIAEICNRDLDSAHDQLALRAALAIDALLSPAHTPS
ncbi:MAG: helix-turn-helix domain-containing protein [bacterium]|nr:helix-turn-helix domain-containing protein [bacterium]